MIPLASFETLAPAELLARRLRAEGIQAWTDNGSGEQLFHFLNPHPHAQWSVVVTAEEAEAAVKQLKELDELENVLQSAIRCPDCGSTEIEYPQFSRNTFLGAIVPAAAAAIGLIEREFYCRSCHFTWAPKANVQSAEA